MAVRRALRTAKALLLYDDIQNLVRCELLARITHGQRSWPTLPAAAMRRPTRALWRSRSSTSRSCDRCAPCPRRPRPRTRCAHAHAHRPATRLPTMRLCWVRMGRPRGGRGPDRWRLRRDSLAPPERLPVPAARVQGAVPAQGTRRTLPLTGCAVIETAQVCLRTGACKSDFKRVALSELAASGPDLRLPHDASARVCVCAHIFRPYRGDPRPVRLHAVQRGRPGRPRSPHKVARASRAC